MKPLTNLNRESITHPADLPADLDNVRRLLAGEIQNYQMEKGFLHRDGRIVYTILGVGLVRDQDGRPSYFVSQIQDITARKEAEQDRERFFVHSLTLTAHAMKGDRERCLEAGMDGYVAKPLQLDELFAAISAATAPSHADWAGNGELITS
ncbi:MAG TPA: PAS domain S-box protein [Pirellulaceae bacterium]|nr:PAS domain S-box protein [Pirellulaceae bacterium]